MDIIRKAGFPELKFKDFRVINYTTAISFEGALDTAKYKEEVCPELLYTPSGFVGARKELKRTEALFTLFQENATMLGTPNISDLCLDVYDELDGLRSCMVPFESEEERELKDRVAKRRKCLKQETEAQLV